MKKLLLSTFLFVVSIHLSAQTISGISPNQGTAGTQITAVITGQNTFFMTGSPQGARDIILQNSNCIAVHATNLAPVDNDHLSADFTIPSGTPNGTYDVVLTQWNYQRLTLPSSFTVTGGTDYSIQNISSSSATEGNTFSATITGQNIQTLSTQAGFQLKLIKGNTIIPASNINVVNASTLTSDFIIPVYSDTGNYDVLITTFSAGCYRLSQAVYVSGLFPKELVSIQPVSGNAGTTLNALVTSRNTFFMTGSPQGIQNFQLKDQHCNVITGTNISLLSDSTFNSNITIPSNARNGSYDVYVNTNTNHSYTLPAAFVISGGVNRDVTSFSPSLFNAGGTLSATITGSDLTNILSANPVVVKLVSTGGYSISATNIIPVSATQAQFDFQIPAYADNGFYQLRITSALGCYNFSNAVQVQGAVPRGLISITPSSGARGQMLTASITAANTFFMTGSPQGTIQTIQFIEHASNHLFTVYSPNFTVINDDSLTVNFTIPYSIPSGLYDVIVHTMSGEDYSINPGFEITGTRITGNLFLDVDSNGVFSPGDVYLNSRRILLLPDSIIAFTNSSGEFDFVVDSGQYTVDVYPDSNYEVTTLPMQYNVNVAGADIDSLLFGINPLQDEYSLYLTITPQIARCGAFVNYYLNYTNFSTTTINGEIIFIPDSSLLYNSSYPSPSHVSGDTLFFDYNNLMVNQSGVIAVTVRIPSIAGTILNSSAMINAADISGNILASVQDTVMQTVVCSFDPNDKSVEPAGEQSANYVLINNYLEYLIRFQNTGTDTAFSVIILDTLSDALDVATFEVAASSHSVDAHLTGHAAEFRFNNILLPDSNIDEAGSHGYIKYRVKPFSTTPSGTITENVAGIYFDLNRPVVTNTTSNTLVDVIPVNTGITQVIINNFIVYPNPSHDVINVIHSEEGDGKYNLRLYNSTGKLVLSSRYTSHEMQFGIHALSAGLYFMQISSDDGKENSHLKIIVQR